MIENQDQKETIKKFNSKVQIEKHDTAAWANIEKLKPDSNVTVPSETHIASAKEWVDTNEK